MDGCGWVCYISSGFLCSGSEDLKQESDKVITICQEADHFRYNAKRARKRAHQLQRNVGTEHIYLCRVEEAERAHELKSNERNHKKLTDSVPEVAGSELGKNVA